MKWGIASALVLASVCAVPLGICGERPIVAIFDMEDKGWGLETQTLTNLTDYMSVLLTRCGYQVVPRDQIRERLEGQKKKSYKSCYDQSCQIEMGREVAAQKSLSSQVFKIADTCQVMATIYDLRKATTEYAAFSEASCSEKELLAAISDISAQLCELLEGKPPSQATVDRKLPEPTTIPKEKVISKATKVIKIEPDKKTVKEPDVKPTKSHTPRKPAKPKVQTESAPEKASRPPIKAESKSKEKPRTDTVIKAEELSPGTLRINTEPKGARIWINNKVVGTTPFETELTAGRYGIKVHIPGYFGHKKIVEIKAGKKKEFSLPLKKIRSGTLVIKTNPVGASIVINNKEAGKSPLKRDVMPGNLAIFAKMKGYETAIKNVRIIPGEKTEVTIKLEKHLPMNPYKKWGHAAFWTGVGIAAFGGVAMWQAEEAADDYDVDGSESAADRNKLWNGLSYTGFVIGGALLATGVVLWILSPGDKSWSEQHAAGAVPTTDGRGLVFTFGGSW